VQRAGSTIDASDGFDKLTAGGFDKLTAGGFDKLTAGGFDQLTAGKLTAGGPATGGCGSLIPAALREGAGDPSDHPGRPGPEPPDAKERT